MFLVELRAMINTEQRTLTAPLCVAAVEVTEPCSYWGCADLRYPLLKAGTSLRTNQLLFA